jgi:flagellar basal body-associated protein FliL
MIVITLSVYIFRSRDENAAGLTYIELSQTLLNEEGLIARMKVNIQVDTDDAKWLQENKKALNDRFPEAATKLDLESLRTPEGFNEAQEELKKGLNQTFQTDKIQAVLLTDLLVQNQR